MKHCPACKTQYSDDTLKYCLQDGTPLAGMSENEMPTVVFGETEATVARSRHDRMNVPVNDPNSAAWQQSQVTRVAAAAPERRNSNTAVTVILTALGMLVIFGVLAFGAWIFFRNSQKELVSNTGNPANLPGGQNNNNAFSSPQGSPLATPASTRTSVTPMPANTGDTPPPTVDNSQIRSEVSQRVYSWKSMLESRDFNGYMSNYAPTVDYYTKRSVSSSAIRADKERAFSLYNSMRVNVSNMSVTTDQSGDAATVTFDKEWVFDGSRPSSGKTQSQLEFRRINGQWLITAERDLKLYYKR